MTNESVGGRARVHRADRRALPNAVRGAMLIRDRVPPMEVPCTRPISSPRCVSVSHR